MLYYDRIDVSEGIDINKTSASKESNICHYWYFLNKRFKFQTYVCNRCHDLLMMSTKLNNIAVLKIKNAEYRCIITGISKSEAITLLQNIDLTEKVKHYKKIDIKSNSEAIKLLEILCWTSKKWKIIN